MELIKVQSIGRFISPETNASNNAYEGTRTNDGVKTIFYYSKGRRVYLSHADFYRHWRTNKIK